MKPRNPTDELNQFGTYDYVIDELIHDAAWVIRAFYDLDHPKRVMPIIFRQLPEYAFMALQAQRSVLTAMGKWPHPTRHRVWRWRWYRVPAAVALVSALLIIGYSSTALDSMPLTIAIIVLGLLCGWYVPLPLSREWDDDR